MMTTTRRTAEDRTRTHDAGSFTVRWAPRTKDDPRPWSIFGDGGWYSSHSTFDEAADEADRLSEQC